MKVILAAKIFAVFIFGAIIFQIALASGMPWGEFAWGGSHPSTLPDAMRLASVFSAVLLLMFLVVVLTRAGLILPRWLALSKKLIWIVVGYCGLGIIANAISPSFWERVIWVPVLIICFVSGLIVAKAK
ncbi:MAG: hypothetical protein HOO97_02910 [Sideroxydans sp.]|nr:hypothetical protein [Sideroxydans sp.]NOT98031.1 hypothetical protein [Sideroxydans sp.]